MDATFESPFRSAVLARQAEVLARPASSAHHMADMIRALAIGSADPATEGQFGLPMRMADVATVLWTRFHKFDAADPRWPDRDRFVLSTGDGFALLYALLCLTGHAGVSVDDIRRFRGLCAASGHPDCDAHPAIETASGPPGQGLATAVGMAIAERNMAARFGKSLVDHRTWAIASDADMMAGPSHEAAALAGHLALSKLTVLYDDGQRPEAGTSPLCCADDVLKRFSAYGWTTKRVDGTDTAQVNAALSLAVRSKKPTLIACHTGVDSDGAAMPAGGGDHADPPDAAGAMGSPGLVEVPDALQTELLNRWQAAGSRGATARRSWLKRLARHGQRAEFERVMAGRLPDSWHEALAELKRDTVDNRPRIATGTASRTCLEILVPMVPELIGGIADPAPASVVAPIAAGNFGGRHIHCGMRAHGMAAAANGMALHGGIIPCLATALALSDELRPALRLSAIMRQRVVYVLSQDSPGPGASGSAQLSAEHLAGLRAMPNLHVFRPADAMETAECWELAIRRADGPSLLVVSERKQPPWRTDPSENRSARGGYVLAEADGPRQATLLATGPELAIAMAARAKLAGDNIAVAVVSMPCWELFARQDAAYRAQVLGGAPRVGIEAAGEFGWAQWLGPEGTFIGVSGFPAAARDEDLYTHFGITPEAVAAAVTRRLG